MSALLLLALACVPGIDDSEVPGFLEADHLLEVEIELAEADWQALGKQRRNLLDMFTGDCTEGLPDGPYTWFPATARIAGREVGEVGVRKKGLIGSDSATRPSLKVDLDRYVDGGRFGGLEMLTLNNARQDPSRLDQCLGYATFARAGVPAPRCQLAHVIVNGEDLGIYAHVESIRREFLADHFADGTGHHYEGTAADFVEGWMGRFEAKDGNDPRDRSDLEAVARAVLAPEGRLMEELGAVVDLDEYARFWAAEVLTGHWDGYSHATNNFHVYRDPTTGRFAFIPWGIDALFDSDHPFGASEPVSMVAGGILAERLYLHPEGQDLYFETLDQVMTEAWDEDVLLEDLELLEALAAPWVLDPDGWAGAVEEVREYLTHHGEEVRAEVAEGRPGWEAQERVPACLDVVGEVSATFSTTWGSTEEWDPDTTADMSISWYGEELAVEGAGAIAGGSEGTATLAVVGVLAPETYIYPWIFFDEERVRPGTVAVDWEEASAYLALVEPGGDGQIIAYVGDGTLDLDEAGTTPGDPVEGALEAAIFGWVPVDAR